MKLRRLRVLLLAFAATSALVAAVDAPPKAPPRSSVPNPFAGRFKQVRERIDALFHLRNEAPPPPDIRTNPFRVPGTPIAPVATGRTDDIAVVSDVATNLLLLQQSVATLRVSGVFEIGGRSHLVINARPYKEGDVVQTQVQGEPVYLRVREISKRSVTLQLNDAEMTLKF